MRWSQRKWPFLDPLTSMGLLITFQGNTWDRGVYTQWFKPEFVTETRIWALGLCTYKVCSCKIWNTFLSDFFLYIARWAAKQGKNEGPEINSCWFLIRAKSSSTMVFKSCSSTSLHSSVGLPRVHWTPRRWTDFLPPVLFCLRVIIIPSFSFLIF